MARFKKAAVMFTAAETARQWAHRNPDKARAYVDKAAAFVDQRTKGKYHSQLEGFSRTAKKGLTGQDTVSGSTVHGAGQTPPAPASPKKPFPDLRA